MPLSNTDQSSNPLSKEVKWSLDGDDGIRNQANPRKCVGLARYSVGYTCTGRKTSHTHRLV